MSKRPHVDATPVSRPGKQRKKSTQAEPTKLVGSTSLDEAKQEIATVDPSWLDKNRLPFKDAVVGYQEEFINVKQSKEWLEELLNLGEWFQPTLKMYGREFQQSRKVIAYATTPFDLQYSGQSMSMSTEWPPAVLACKSKVEAVLGCTFNHCMLNRYDDGSVHIGKHRDNKENKIIAAVSLGVERDFVMTHDQHEKGQDVNKEDRSVMRKRWPLKDGSLVLMAGQTQAYWKHEIVRRQSLTLASQISD